MCGSHSRSGQRRALAGGICIGVALEFELRHLLFETQTLLSIKTDTHMLLNRIYLTHSCDTLTFT